MTLKASSTTRFGIPDENNIGSVNGINGRLIIAELDSARNESWTIILATSTSTKGDFKVESGILPCNFIPNHPTSNRTFNEFIRELKMG